MTMISDAVHQTLDGVVRFCQIGLAEFHRQRVELIKQVVVSRQAADPQTVLRILKASEASQDLFRKELASAEAREAERQAKIEAEQIAELRKPVVERMKSLNAEWAAARAKFEAESEALQWELRRIELPLESHQEIAQRVRDTALPMPDSIRGLGWGDEISELSKQNRKLQGDRPEPGPEATEGQRAAHRQSEIRRIETVAKNERRIRVLTRAWELVQQQLRCPVTGIWDPFRDPTDFLPIAEKEIAAEIAAEAREREQREESADKSRFRTPFSPIGADGVIGDVPKQLTQEIDLG